MGFPLRSNIFEPGSPAQKYFARFPVQVAVLFSPGDREFASAFRDTFVRLHRITGDDVAFFAVLEPPKDWLREPGASTWWARYKDSAGVPSYSFDDRVLVREIARLFGVGWHELPVIVAASNLWTAEFVTVPTSTSHLEPQLRALGNAVERWGRPNITHLRDALGDATGFEPDEHAADEGRRAQLARSYEFLDIGSAHGDHRNLEAYRALLRRQLDDVEFLLRRARRAKSGEEEEGGASPPLTAAHEDAAGRLVPPATVAMRFMREMRARRAPDMEALDEEAETGIATALRVGDFLEHLDRTQLDGLASLHFGGSRRPGDGRGTQVDYSPGAVGVWKAFEVEVNLSVVQAARTARGVPMPDFFATWDPDLPLEHGQVATGNDRRGRPIRVGINDRRSGRRPVQRHRFLDLGEAFYVHGAMVGRGDEHLDEVIGRCLGAPLAAKLLGAWERIRVIRNPHSHERVLSRGHYEEILNLCLAGDVLGPLLRLKTALREPVLVTLP